MRTLVSGGILAAGILATCASVHAQSEEEIREERIREQLEILRESLNPGDDDRNAANLYQTALEELIRTGDYGNEDWEEVWDAVERNPGPGAYQSAAVRRILEHNASAIEHAKRASRLGTADFGLNTDAGMMTLLPHLNYMRRLSRLMTLQADMERSNGRMNDAAGTMSALMQMSSHAASDGIAICSLVSMASIQSGFDSINDAIARGQLDAESARIMLDGFDFESDDPFRFKDLGYTEIEMLEKTIAQFDDPGPQLAAEMDWLVDEEIEGTPLASMSPEEVDELLEQARPGFELGARALAEDDPDKAMAMMAEFQSQLEAGDFGLLAQLFMTDFDRLLKSKIQFEETLAEYRRIMGAIASGENPDNFANAAILYAQAFPYLARINETDQEILEMVRKIVSVTGSCDAIPKAMLDEIRGLLEQSAPALSILHRAARFEQCNWEYAALAEDYELVIPMGEWVRPMRAAVRLLLADAALAVCLADANGDDSNVARAIADALAVALHLGDGTHLMSSVVCAASLDELVSMAESTLPERALEAEDKTLLADRFARLDGGDPLGWKAARAAMLRKSTHEILMRYGLDDLEDASQLASNWNNERLASIAYYQKQVDPTKPDHLPPFPRNEGQGELYAIDDVVEIDDESHQRLGSAHRRLIELLQILDTEQPIDTTRWGARGNDAISRFDGLMDEIEVKNTENPDSGTE
ncbi:MAG: hypothetical protein P8J45_02735 [Phycisphaerales bacterium]|nr:hypothetical protein [Phycisphaerales bacterium]|eukprot:gene470-20_t